MTRNQGRRDRPCKNCGEMMKNPLPKKNYCSAQCLRDYRSFVWETHKDGIRYRA